MSGLNQCVLVGRLCADPEITYLADGKALAKFTVAVNRNFKNKATGEYEADFIRCVAWQQTAEFIGQYLTKGRLIGLSGRIQVRSYEKDGERRYMTEIIVKHHFG